MSDLKKVYNEQIVLKFKEELGYDNVMEVLKIIKIILNMGVGEVVVDCKVIEGVLFDMIVIVGQKLLIIKVCKFVVGFKICEGWLIGCKVILCNCCMYEFLDCLVVVVIFWMCDFCGLNFKLFDGWGNYFMGLCEQIVFFEVDFDKVDKLCGMDIIIIIMVKIDDEVCVLLCVFNFLLKG